MVPNVRHNQADAGCNFAPGSTVGDLHEPAGLEEEAHRYIKNQMDVQRAVWALTARDVSQSEPVFGGRFLAWRPPSRHRR